MRPAVRGARLQGDGSLLAGTNADRLANGTDENLSVPNLVSTGRVLDGFHRTLDQRIVHDDFDNYLRDEVYLIFGAPVEFDMALLSAEALRLDNGHAVDAHFVERSLHVVELEGLDDGFDFLHGTSARVPLGVGIRTGSGRISPSFRCIGTSAAPFSMMIAPLGART
jgi:hypothetical protein